MLKKKFPFLFLISFIAFSQTVLWAATVTNNGNIPVRVQYKTPDGQYQDLGTVQPGQSMDIPGGVEKVKIVRQLGEWAKPLGPGEVLDVEVKDGDKSVGKMDWYGDKVFFDLVTEGPPLVSAPTEVVPAIAPPKTEPAPEPTPATPTEKTEEPETDTPQKWPFSGGGFSDVLFFFQLLMMWPFLFYLAYRSWRRPGYYGEDGRWVETGGLGWGWGWWNGGQCGGLGFVISLIFGLGLGGLALWGHAHFVPADGLIPRFGQDLYSFPYFIFSLFGWGLTERFSDIAFVLTFWILASGSFGLLCTVIPIKLLYATPVILAVLPFFLLTRGCAGCFGPQDFDYDGGYPGMPFYPAAMASLFLLPMIFALILDWFDPYDSEDQDDHGHDEEGYDDDDEDGDHFHGHRRHAWEDFLDGNPWPLIVFLTGGSLCSFYGAAYEFGMDSAIAYYLHQTPLSLGLNLFPPMVMIPIFWVALFGMLAWAYYTNRSRFLLYACLIPAFLSLLFLMTGNYIQRDYAYYYDDEYDEGPPVRIKPLIQSYIRTAKEEAEERQTGVAPDLFGDQIGARGLKNNQGFGRAVMFQDGDRDREQDQLKW